MRVRGGERGVALLTVLLLVAVMAVIAAASLERLRLATRLSGNSFAVDQARAYAGAAETIALSRAGQLLARSPTRTTLAGGWHGRPTPVPLPGGRAVVTVTDGGNCFNLNSVVSGDSAFDLAQRPVGIRQLVGLMVALQVPQAEAERIAAGIADFIDSDVIAQGFGAEDPAYAGAETPFRTPNSLIVDPSEIRVVAGMTPEIYARIRPYLCALPTAELSPMNVNTLTVEQAPLVAMMAPGTLTLDRARSILAERPPSGYGSPDEFWRHPAIVAAGANAEVVAQVGIRTRWFAVATDVDVGGATVSRRTLVDAREPQLRVAMRLAGRGD